MHSCNATCFSRSKFIVGTLYLLGQILNTFFHIASRSVPNGIQKTEQSDDDKHKYRSDDETDSGRVDLLPVEDIHLLL